MNSFSSIRLHAEDQADDADRLDEINLAFAAAAREDAERFEQIHDIGGNTDNSHTRAIRAAGRLADAKKIFAHRGWDVLPQNIRGQRILAWGADMAFLASPNNPKRSVRNWCRKWAPWLKPAELDKIIAGTGTTNKRWNDDQCAAVLVITVSDRTTLGLRFIGAEDDPDHKVRDDLRREKNAACQRRRRAANSSGSKAGRPTLNLTAEQKKAHVREQTAKRNVRLRARRKNPSSPIRVIGAVTGFSVTQKSLTPWQSLGMSKASYYRRKKAGTLPRPIMVRAIEPLDTDGIDFRVFGITGITIKAGTRIVSQWREAA
ncbi:hypothetical protein [Bradyrhizobium jicamae]|uniref:hypothetical protein n=1 Tax=Bradyrhizobium jicamae TaxID=280332 RepID=UPI001BACBC12|nr:hypothetical protein [Bradyrhizobium jicamae]MBR0934868.1 hypothetical protein [Bradyrhizobium jicamae]